MKLIILIVLLLSGCVHIQSGAYYIARAIAEE